MRQDLYCISQNYQFLHPRSAKTRGALLQLLSTKLNSQYLKLDIASFTLLNRAFQVNCFWGIHVKSSNGKLAILSGSQVEPPEVPVFTQL